MRFPHTLSLHDARDIHSLHCHFERSREILLALCSSLPLSRKASNFTLSHIRRYTGVQERSRASLGMTLCEIAFSKHIRCTLREINPFSHTVISSAARNLPCTLLFLAPFAKVFPFSAITHTALYRCARKIEGFARDDDTGIAFSQHILYTMRRISPYDAKEKSPGKSRSFFVSERLICQTVRAWCLLLLQYQ